MAGAESKGSRRYDKENLLWQSTVAIKSDPVGVRQIGLEKRSIAMRRVATWDLPRRIATGKRPIAMRKAESRELQRLTDLVKPPIGMRKGALKGQRNEHLGKVA